MNLKKGSIILVAAMIMVFAGCEKDSDNDPVTNGQFTYEESSYSLSQGVLIGVGLSDTTSFGMELILMSSGLNIIEVGNSVTEVTGIGDIIGLSMYSASQTILETGTYTFGISQTAGTCVDGFLYVQYETQNEDVLKQDEIIGGTLVVNKDGDQYNLTMNMTTYLGKTVTADFKGTLKYYVETVDKSIGLK